MVFVQKWPFCHLFFFWQYRPGKCLLRYSRRKKRLSRLLKHAVENVKKLTFFQRVDGCFWSKNDHFFNFVFLGKIGHGNVFFDILEGKNAFLGYKNKNLKKAKNWHFFQRGEPMVLVEKWPFFQLCFFMQYRPGKCLLRYCRTKKRLSRL